MKQTWMIFLLVLLAAMPAAAASITVNSPAAGETLEIGVIKPITWTFSGLPNATKIKIVLWCNGSNLGIIANDLNPGSNGQGSFGWDAGTYTGGPAAAGSGYSVRIRTMDNSVSGFSGSFALKDKSGNTNIPLPITKRPINSIPNMGELGYPCLAVFAPKKDDSCDPNNIIYIKWNRNGTQDANVSITLLRAGKGVMLGGVTLAASAPNNGTFNWDPSSLLPAPGAYILRVRTLDGKCEALSATFTIKEIGGIELLSPKGGEVWESGTSHAVTWKRLGNVQTLDILLNRAGSWTKTLVQGVDAKLGTKSVAFVRGDTDGANQVCYKVFINHSGGNASNPSGCITLTGNPDLAVSASFYPGLANIGTDLTFTIKVENKGMVRSQACQGDFKFNGAIHKTFSVPAIDPGATATVTVTWKLACPGKVTISVDPGGANVEADKTNNVWEKPIC